MAESASDKQASGQQDDGPLLLPWFRPALRDWSIVGMNHYRITMSVHLGIEARRLYVAMTKDGRCITAEGVDQLKVFDDLERQALALSEAATLVPQETDTGANESR